MSSRKYFKYFSFTRKGVTSSGTARIHQHLHDREAKALRWKTLMFSSKVPRLAVLVFPPLPVAVCVSGNETVFPFSVYRHADNNTTLKNENRIERRRKNSYFRMRRNGKGGEKHFHRLILLRLLTLLSHFSEPVEFQPQRQKLLCSSVFCSPHTPDHLPNSP